MDPVLWASVNAIKEQQNNISSVSAVLENVSMTSSGNLAIINDLTSQVASQEATLTLQGQALEKLEASSSASVEYILANDPLFKDSQDKIANLQAQVNILSQQLQEQASASAFLTQIIEEHVLGASTSAALDLGDVDLNNATISGDLMVLGRTTVSDLGVTGNINAGLLTIHGLEGEINNLGGDLYLQKNGLGGIDMLNGKVVVDMQGNMAVQGTVTADSIESNTYTVLGDQSIGSATIPAGSTSIDVFTPIATESSKIFLTATSLTDKQIIVTSKSEGKFRVSIKTLSTLPITFDWWIVGNK
jgi:hypothetical protein